MVTKRRRKNPNSLGNKLANGAKQQSGRLLADWAALTWNQDRTKIGPLSISALNWLLLLVFGICLYLLPQHRGLIAIIIGLWVIVTIGRAAKIMPARRKTLQLIYDQNQRTAGLPRGTTNAPVDPAKRITVRNWGKKHQPTDLTLIVGDCPAASSMYARIQVEKTLAASMGEPPTGAVWVFEWPTPTQVKCSAAGESSEKASQQMFEDRVRAKTANLLRINLRDSADYAYECTGWFGTANKMNKMAQTPTTIRLALGSFDATSPIARDTAERTLDKQLNIPGEWLYSWGDNDVEMKQVERMSTEAKRKRTTRKINDDVIGLLNNSRGDVPLVSVEKWSEKEATIDFPLLISIDFGTRNLADRKIRDNFETDFDTSMTASYNKVTWLYDWKPSGSSTELIAKAVPAESEQALRKYAEKRLRNVVESKFGSSKNFVDCDIMEWQDELTPAGETLPRKALVNFGDYDVTKTETQDAFEMHWDSLTTACDWNYQWSPAEGTVVMTAVDPLPSISFFPIPGTPEFDAWNNSARQGKIDFGPRKGGGRLIWDLSKTPHSLIGGKTGMGKSVSLNMVAFAAMYNPDVMELIVCDPKRTDFTWTPEFPNVARFAATDAEIVAAVGMAKQEMDRRQTLLSKAGVRNIGEMRSELQKNPELISEYGPAPKRLILFFDELADFLAKGSDKDNEELKDEARSDLETIARLGRAMEVNIVAAAQKPDSKIVSTQLRSQLGFRLGVGPLDRHESEMILNSDHGTRHPASGSPKGRSWGYDPIGGYQLCQVSFLADESGALSWMPEKTVLGFKDMVRDRLGHLGYASHQITNTAGGTETRWAKIDGAGVNPDAPTVPMETPVSV